MKKLVTCCALCSGILCLFVSPGLTAAPSQSRAEIISQALDCVALHEQTDNFVDWNNVCYVEDTDDENGSDDVSQGGARIPSFEVSPVVVTTEAPADTYRYEPPPEQDVAPYPASDDVFEKYESRWDFDRFLARDNPLNKLSVAFDYFRFIYEEPELMKDQGNMAGFEIGYTYRLSNNEHIESVKDIFSDTNKVNMFKVEFSRRQGEIDYKSEGTGSIEDVEDYILEVRGLMGYDIPVKDHTLITPFAGFGYRYLNDDTGGRISTTGAKGYERENKCYYMPLGFMTDTQINQSWKFGFSFEYDVFLDGQQISHLEDVGPMYTDADTGLSYVSDPIKNEQYEGYGMRASFKLVKLNKSFDLFFQPYVNYWEKEESDPTQATSQDGSIGWYYDAAHNNPVWYVEPENKTTEYGVKVGFMF
jgi:hypothetical protein